MDQIKTSKHTVSITEAGANNQLRPVVLLNLLQDIAEEHASRIGIGVKRVRLVCSKVSHKDRKVPAVAGSVNNAILAERPA
ncbi:MAG: hypothetical protein ACYSPJ_01305 [Planctomycetota bacterium]|jgi:hypothetical protein